jgi:hypothetical protein
LSFNWIASREFNCFATTAVLPVSFGEMCVILPGCQRDRVDHLKELISLPHGCRS